MASLGATATGRALTIFSRILHLFDESVSTGSVPFETITIMYGILIFHSG